jgi:hypothetical protein
MRSRGRAGVLHCSAMFVRDACVERGEREEQVDVVFA